MEHIYKVLVLIHILCGFGQCSEKTQIRTFFFFLKELFWLPIIQVL